MKFKVGDRVHLKAGVRYAHGLCGVDLAQEGRITHVLEDELVVAFPRHAGWCGGSWRGKLGEFVSLEPQVVVGSRVSVAPPRDDSFLAGMLPQGFEAVVAEALGGGRFRLETPGRELGCYQYPENWLTISAADAAATGRVDPAIPRALKLHKERGQV